MVKEYTVQDLVKSSADKDVNVPFLDGVIPIRIKWMNQKGFALFIRSHRGDALSRQAELTRELTRKLVRNEKGEQVEEEWTDAEWNKLPPGFVITLQDEMMTHLGLTASVDELKKMYEEELQGFVREGQKAELKK